jgi:hypothetical protein
MVARVCRVPNLINWGQIPIVLQDVLVFVGAHPVRDGFWGRVPRPSPTGWAPTRGKLGSKNWGQIPIVFYPGFETEYTVCSGDGLRIERGVRVFQPAAAKAVAAILTILGCRVPSFGV